MRALALLYPVYPLRPRYALPPPPEGEELARNDGFCKTIALAFGGMAFALRLKFTPP